jgi:hypothetical protein
VTSCCPNGGYQLLGGLCCLHSTVWIQQGQPINYKDKCEDLHLEWVASCKIEAFLLMNGTPGTWGCYVYRQFARNVPGRWQGDIRMAHFLHTFPMATFYILNNSLGHGFKPNYIFNLYSIQPCTIEIDYSSERVHSNNDTARSQNK